MATIETPEQHAEIVDAQKRFRETAMISAFNSLLRDTVEQINALDKEGRARVIAAMAILFDVREEVLNKLDA